MTYKVNSSRRMVTEVWTGQRQVDVGLLPEEETNRSLTRSLDQTRLAASRGSRSLVVSVEEVGGCSGLGLGTPP